MSALRPLIIGVGLLCLLCFHAFTQQPGFTITGTVVQENTNQPINRVLVTIVQSQHPQNSASVVTQADGRFGFSGLPAGKYSLSAQTGTSPARAFHQDGQYSTAIVAGPGLDTAHIIFPLEPLTFISGTVTEEEGDPVRNAQVHLFRSGVFDGRNTIRAARTVSTNAAGEFYFGHLEPGRYLIAVQARPWYTQSFLPPTTRTINPSPIPSDLDVAYPVTFSGNVTDPDAASFIQIAAGSPGNVQISLRPVPSLHIHVASSEQTPNPPGISLSALGPDDLAIPVHSGMSFASPTELTMSGIAPGKYWLAAQRFGRGRFEAGSREKVEITSDATLDVNSLPKSAISGKLTFEGGAPPQGRVLVLLRNEANERNAAFLLAGADGALTANGGTVEPGKYAIVLANTSEYFLKSVAVKGGRYSGGVLQIPESGAVELSLIAAKGTSNINGIALRNDQPCAGAMVLLIPKDPGTPLIPRDQSDSDGSFTLRGVPPGRYTLIAIDDGRDLPYADPEAIKPYLAGGQAVSVPLQNEAKLNANVQTRQR